MSLYHRGCSKICSTQLKQVESVAYLNVTLYNKKSFWTSKANKLLGMVRRNFRNCPRKVRETVYKTMVRAKLEYTCETWDPYYKKDIAIH